MVNLVLNVKYEYTPIYIRIISIVSASSEFSN